MQARGRGRGVPRPAYRRAPGPRLAAGGRRGPARPGRRRSPIRSSRVRPPSCSPRPRCWRTTGWSRTDAGLRRERQLGHAGRTPPARLAPITDAHAHAWEPHAGPGHPGLEQHRDGQILLAAPARRSSSTTLRDFGFGSPTGVEFPWRESRGCLATPDRWQPDYTRPSLAMGYEFGVTPLQLAAAYAAIANDGVLLAPTLVREIRDPEGRAALSPSAGAGAPGGLARDRGPASRLPARRGGRRRHRRAGPAGQLHPARQDRHRACGSRTAATSQGQYTASFAALFPADDSATGGHREDRRPARASTTAA